MSVLGKGFAHVLYIHYEQYWQPVRGVHGYSYLNDLSLILVISCWFAGAARDRTLPS